MIVRWPRGESVIGGRSHCDACDRTLGPLDLIPILSFMLVRGRCRTCGCTIDRTHLAVEMSAATVAAISIFAQPGLAGVFGMVLGWFLIALAWLDVRHFWLPDRLTLPLILLGLAQAFHPGTTAPLDAAIGVAAGFLLLYLLNAAYKAMRDRDGLGGGDAKLLAAGGAWLGWQAIPLIVLLSSGLAIVSIVAAGAMGRKLRLDRKIPYGAFLAIAIFVLWLWRPLLRGTFF